MYGCDLFQLVSTSTIHIGQDLWLRPRCEQSVNWTKLSAACRARPMFPIAPEHTFARCESFAKIPASVAWSMLQSIEDAMFGLKVIGFPGFYCGSLLAQDTHGVWTPRVCVWAAGQQIAPICTGEEPQEFFYTSWVWVEISSTSRTTDLLFLSITAHKSRYSHSLSRWNLGTPNFDPALWSVPPLEGSSQNFTHRFHRFLQLWLQ